MMSFLKWPGGKRWFIPHYAHLLPTKFGREMNSEGSTAALCPSNRRKVRRPYGEIGKTKKNGRSGKRRKGNSFRTSRPGKREENAGLGPRHTAETVVKRVVLGGFFFTTES